MRKSWEGNSMKREGSIESERSVKGKTKAEREDASEETQQRR